MGLSKNQEKEYAKILYVNQKLSQKEIAERCGVSEKTISKWIKDGKWEDMKRSMIIVKEEQLSDLYDKLATLNNYIKEFNGNMVSNKDVDTISKLTASIQKLEVETSIGEIIDVAKKIIDFVRQRDLEFAKKLTIYFDLFIQEKM